MKKIALKLDTIYKSNNWNDFKIIEVIETQTYKIEFFRF